MCFLSISRKRDGARYCPSQFPLRPALQLVSIISCPSQCCLNDFTSWVNKDISHQKKGEGGVGWGPVPALLDLTTGGCCVSERYCNKAPQTPIRQKNLPISLHCLTRVNGSPWFVLLKNLLAFIIILSWIIKMQWKHVYAIRFHGC